jgi:hypothetical protein
MTFRRAALVILPALFLLGRATPARPQAAAQGKPWGLFMAGASPGFVSWTVDTPAKRIAVGVRLEYGDSDEKASRALEEADVWVLLKDGKNLERLEARAQGYEISLGATRRVAGHVSFYFRLPEAKQTVTAVVLRIDGQFHVFPLEPVR